MSMNLSRPYKTRAIRHLETCETQGWRVKVYGVSALGARPDQDLIDAIKAVAADLLPQPPVTDDRYGVAFLYAHQGADGSGFAAVNWWARENELHHHQYESPGTAIGQLRPVAETGGSSACVWDLAVIEHERRAWVECVLANSRGPDLTAYLRRTLDADV